MRPAITILALSALLSIGCSAAKPEPSLSPGYDKALIQAEDALQEVEDVCRFTHHHTKREALEKALGKALDQANQGKAKAAMAMFEDTTKKANTLKKTCEGVSDTDKKNYIKFTSIYNELYYPMKRCPKAEANCTKARQLKDQAANLKNRGDLKRALGLIWQAREVVFEFNNNQRKLAAEKAAKTSTDTAPKKTSTPKDKAIVAVFRIRDQYADLKPKMADMLTEYLSTAIAEKGVFQIVPPADIHAALRQKKSESYKECFDQKCQIELGRELSATKSLSSSIMMIGDICSVSAALFDLKRQTSDLTAKANGDCTDKGLMNSVDKVASELRDWGAR